MIQRYSWRRFGTSVVTFCACVVMLEWMIIVTRNIPEAQSPEIRYEVSGSSNLVIQYAANPEQQPNIQDPVDQPPRNHPDELSNFAKEKLDTFQDKLSELVYKFRKDVFHRPEKPKLKDICARFEREGREDKIFIPNVWKKYSSIDPDSDIVVVTQMHEGKLNVLDRFLRHWDGGFSVTLHLNTTTAHTLPELLQTSYRAVLERRNIDVHIVANEGEFYPINYLRNVALNHTAARYVFLSDVDFAPSYGLHRYAMDMIRAGHLDGKKSFVVPAFEFPHQQNVTDYPGNKTELLHIWSKRHVIQFHEGFTPGHGPTNYKKWRTATEPYTVEYRDAYEPYLIMKRQDVPVFDQRFVGRYGNKLVHRLEVAASGVEFVVLPNAFTIHYPHYIKWNVPYMGCCGKLAKKFKEEIRVKYNTDIMDSPGKRKENRLKREREKNKKL